MERCNEKREWVRGKSGRLVSVKREPLRGFEEPRRHEIRKPVRAFVGGAQVGSECGEFYVHRHV